MFEAGDIREWRGHNVVDSSGHKIGMLESVYVDTGTDQPAFATVTVGMPTRHRLVFVPLTGATVGPGYLKVTYPKGQVKDAPSMVPMSSQGCRLPPGDGICVGMPSFTNDTPPGLKSMTQQQAEDIADFLLEQK